MRKDPRFPRLGGSAKGRVTTTPGNAGSGGSDSRIPRAGRAVRAGQAGRAALLSAVLVTAAMTPVVAEAGSAQATTGGYAITEITALGQSAPGGGTFVNDFEPSAINSSGAVAFTADLSVAGQFIGEGVFIAKNGTITQVLRAGMAAPGGVTLGQGELGRLAMNDAGDLVTGFQLNTVGPNTPFGIDGGVFRYTASTRTLSAVAVPGQQMPDGGTLLGGGFNFGINNRGDIIYQGIDTGTAVSPGTPPNYQGASAGLFEQSKDGVSTRIVGPGDAAPGGGVFDDAWNGSNNNAGDIAFSAHVQSDPCINIGDPWACGDSLYLRNHATGAITSIAHQGDPAPGGGDYQTAFGGLVNSAGQVAFVANTPEANVYQWSKGVVTPVAITGESMPGGGHYVTGTGSAGPFGQNAQGDVSFTTALDSVTNGLNDTGAYVWSHGTMHLVARTGTVIPGVGTISYLGEFLNSSGGTNPPAYSMGGQINNRGQVFFTATMTNGTQALLVATPAG